MKLKTNNQPSPPPPPSHPPSVSRQLPLHSKITPHKFRVLTEEIQNLNHISAASKRYPIKIRGYEITVYCEWGQNGAPTLTYFEQQGGDPSYVLWGGSIYSTEPKYSTSRREWQQARIEVNRCFVALDIKDISHSTITSGSSYPDNFEYMCTLDYVSS